FILGDFLQPEGRDGARQTSCAMQRNDLSIGEQGNRSLQFQSRNVPTPPCRWAWNRGAHRGGANYQGSAAIRIFAIWRSFAHEITTLRFGGLAESRNKTRSA